MRTVLHRTLLTPRLLFTTLLRISSLHTLLLLLDANYTVSPLHLITPHGPLDNVKKLNASVKINCLVE